MATPYSSTEFEGIDLLVPLTPATCPARRGSWVASRNGP